MPPSSGQPLAHARRGRARRSRTSTRVEAARRRPRSTALTPSSRRRQHDADLARGRVLDDVRQRLLHEPVERRLGLGREPLSPSIAATVARIPVRSAKRSREPLERGHEPEVVERARPQLDGEAAHVLERLDDELAKRRPRPARPPRRSRRRGSPSARAGSRSAPVRSRRAAPGRAAGARAPARRSRAAPCRARPAPRGRPRPRRGRRRSRRAAGRRPRSGAPCRACRAPRRSRSRGRARPAARRAPSGCRGAGPRPGRPRGRRSPSRPGRCGAARARGRSSTGHVPAVARAARSAVPQRRRRPRRGGRRRRARAGRRAPAARRSARAGARQTRVEQPLEVGLRRRARGRSRAATRAGATTASPTRTSRAFSIATAACDGEQGDDLLVLLGEVLAARLLRQVEVPVGDAAQHDRDAEEAAHRRMVGREADRAWVAREVVETQRPAPRGSARRGCRGRAEGRRSLRAAPGRCPSVKNRSSARPDSSITPSAA